MGQQPQSLPKLKGHMWWATNGAVTNIRRKWRIQTTSSGKSFVRRNRTKRLKTPPNVLWAKDADKLSKPQQRFSVRPWRNPQPSHQADSVGENTQSSSQMPSLRLDIAMLADDSTSASAALEVFRKATSGEWGPQNAFPRASSSDNPS